MEDMDMHKSYLFVRILILSFFLAFSSAEAFAKEDGILQAYETWIKAIGTAKGDANQVTRLYDKEAILVPTLSPSLHFNSKDQLTNYFKKLTSLPDISVTTQKFVTQNLGDYAISSGKYIFTYKDDLNETISLHARFTFVYKKQGKEWLIVNHHSSLSPPAID